MNAIYFDMDGTIADFYGVANWLDYLKAEEVKPYAEAKPLVNMNSLAKAIHKLQAKGYTVNIISWGAKNSSAEYLKKVKKKKKKWLNKHLKSVKFDNIIVTNYGNPKENFGFGILFDDEENNRKNWKGISYNEKNILENLKKLA